MTLRRLENYHVQISASQSCIYFRITWEAFKTILIPESHPHILIHLGWVLDIGMFNSWPNNSNTRQVI